MQTNFTIIFEAAEEGGFTAFIPEVPGAVSEGETLEEAREMVISAMDDVLAARRELAMAHKSSSAIVQSFAIVA